MTAKKGPVTKEAAGRWLREQRRLHGYETVGAFARALNVDPSRISNYELGKSEIPDDRAEQIAELLGMEVIDVRRNLGLWVPPDPDTREHHDDVQLSSLSPAAAREQILRDLDRDPELALVIAEMISRVRGMPSPPGPNHAQEDENSYQKGKGGAA